MKHVQVLSMEKPAQAEQTAWVEWKNVVGAKPLTNTQAAWVASQVDQYLQK